jgi:hypothetical protein
MAALTQKRMTRGDAISTIALPLASGQKVYQGGAACYDSGALGAVKKAATGSTTLVPIGEFAESADNTSGGAPNVNVRLQHPINAAWYDNVTGGNAVTMATNGFGLCYWADDHTVTASSSSASPAGRVWDVDTIKGVLVEFIGTATSL